MRKGKPTYMNAPIDLYGHVDEQGVCVCFNNTFGKCCVSDMEAASIMPLSVPGQGLMCFLRMLVSAKVLVKGCSACFCWASDSAYNISYVYSSGFITLDSSPTLPTSFEPVAFIESISLLRPPDTIITTFFT